MGLVLLSVVLTEIEIWISDDVPGPRLGRALPLLLLLIVPIIWRRRFPLAACVAVLASLDAYSIWHGSPEGVELFVPLAAASYSVGAYCGRRGALAGLGVLAGGYAVYALEDVNVVHGGGTGEWAGAFFGVAILALWLLGVFVRSRRESAELAEHAAKLEHEAVVAVAEERARMARELHDIVSHNISVVVLQAAGARAAGPPDEGTLEKIEQSGREALVEMRRLLGVLREDVQGVELEPQPGIGQLEQLAESVRAVGLAVELDISDDCRELPPAVQLSVYRIIQEALTNALKHARASRAEVRVDRHGDLLSVAVLDDGASRPDGDEGGHGLIGMRERVALFGGELRTGPQAGGGFAVRATLPLIE